MTAGARQFEPSFIFLTNRLTSLLCLSCFPVFCFFLLSFIKSPCALYSISVIGRRFWCCFSASARLNSRFPRKLHNLHMCRASTNNKHPLCTVLYFSKSLRSLLISPIRWHAIRLLDKPLLALLVLAPASHLDDINESFPLLTRSTAGVRKSWTS